MITTTMKAIKKQTQPTDFTNPPLLTLNATQRCAHPCGPHMMKTLNHESQIQHPNR